MPAGRPSKYDPSFCATVIASGEEGKTLAEMAKDLGVNRATVKDWMGQHKEFSSAIKTGLDAAQAWWEERGRVATFGGVYGFNSTSYIFNMKNRFKEDWADVKLIGSDPENPLPSAIDASKLSTSALREILAARNGTD